LAAQTQFDAVLISSDQYEARLAERARRIFPLARLYQLYDWQVERPAVTI